MPQQTERNIGYSPKFGASVAFQKTFFGTATAIDGMALLGRINSLQIPAAGLRATRKISRNANAVAIVGLGKRAILTFLCANGSTTKTKVEHFDPTKSVDGLGSALVGHIRSSAGSVSTACVEAQTQSVEYV